MIRIFLFLAVLIGSFFNAQSQPINSLHPCKIANGKMAHFRDTTEVVVVHLMVLCRVVTH